MFRRRPRGGALGRVELIGLYYDFVSNFLSNHSGCIPGQESGVTRFGDLLDVTVFNGDYGLGEVGMEIWQERKDTAVFLQELVIGSWD